MAQVQLLCAVLCLAVAMAFPGGPIANVPNEPSKPAVNPIQELTASVSVMQRKQGEMQARQAEMQARQVEMQSRQREMATKQASNLAILNSMFELLRNVSGKKLTCPQWFQPNYSLNSCYYFSQTQLSWQQARQKCLEMRGYLVEVESKEEDDFIRDTIAARGSSFHWLGGTDTLQEGFFRWSHSGRALTYTNWFAGQPDNINNEDCILTWTDLKWNDGTCEYGTYFICEAN